MEPKAALELAVWGLNRLTLNPIERVGINAAVQALAELVEKSQSPVKPKEDEAPPP